MNNLIKSLFASIKMVKKKDKIVLAETNPYLHQVSYGIKKKKRPTKHFNKARKNIIKKLKSKYL